MEGELLAVLQGMEKAEDNKDNENARYDLHKLPDLTNKVALVTGAK